MNAPDLRPLSSPPRRQPACLALGMLCLGIGADRVLGLSTYEWLSILFAAGICWIVFRKSSAVKMGSAFVCVIALGAAVDHSYWFDRAADDVLDRATDESQSVLLLAKIQTRPAIRLPDETSVPGSRPVVGTSNCVIECLQLEDPTEIKPPISVSGRARLTIRGDLLHVQPGDTVRILGRLSRIAGPDNPGEFDFRRYMRTQQIDCVVFTDHPQAVQLVRRANWWSWRASFASLRDQSHVILHNHLDSDTLPIAAALLLGNRDLLQDEQREEFVESGTMHLLAISGLHVGILAWLVVLLCRLFRASPRAVPIVLIAALLGYATLTEARPSVVRATILISLAVWGRRSIRSVDLNNSLWVTGILILLWNPACLFDAGTQLSFLSVIGISLALHRQPTLSFDWLEGPILQFTLRDRLHALAALIVKQILLGYWMMLGITLLTAPVVAAEFGVISPAGMLLNVLLLPLVTPVIWIGFATLFCGFLLPFLAPIAGFCFHYGLKAVLGIIHVVVDIPGSHLYVPAIPNWWMAGFYGLVIVFAIVHWMNRVRPARIFFVHALLVWLIVGLTAGSLLPRRDGELRVCFLSVGHGLSVIVNTPDNHTLLYDCGCINSASRAERVAEGALRHFGVATLDAVLISHADSDHYNGVAGILDRFPVGTVFINEATVRDIVPPIQPVFDAANEQDVPVQVLQAGDSFELDQVQFRILHPPPADVLRESSDNAHSLVLEIQFGEQRILLTGDVENDGLNQLLSQPSNRNTIVLAPHHGSPRSNPVRFLEWSQPQFVVASAGRKDRVFFPDSHEETVFISTHDSGAVTFHVRQKMSVRFETFHGTRTHNPPQTL